jgi:hypothetical protein
LAEATQLHKEGVSSLFHDLLGKVHVISAPKCAVFQIIPTKNSWYIADPSLTTETGDQIPHVNADTCIRYLAIGSPRGKVLPWRDWKRTSRPQSRGGEQLALKPHQKAQFISVHMYLTCYTN